MVDGDLRHDLGYEAADGVFQPLVVCERRRARRQQRPDGFEPQGQRVAQGDVISARGLGKFEVAEVGGLSKKGRTALLLRRYL